MKLLSRSGLRTALCLATLLPLVSITAAPTKKSSPQPKPEPALEAEFSINPPELSPASTIEVVFPTPMIDKARVGSTEAESPLVMKPALKGEFHWVSTRSGHFKLSEAPKFNASYDFSLRNGLTDLAGKALSTEQLASVNSAQFRVIDQSPKWFDSSDTDRLPTFLFEFNDNVDATKAASSIVFVSEKPALKVAAKVRLATGKDFKGNTTPQPTWAEEIAKVKPTLASEATRMSALVVEPSEPLSVATNWKLTIATTLTNASGHDTLAQGDDIALGDVRPFNVTHIGAHTPFDSSYYIDIDFNKALYPSRDEEWKDEELNAIAQKIASLVSIEPNVPVKASLTRRSLRLEGSFELGKPYRVVVDPRVTSGDNLALEKPGEGEALFVPNPPYVAAPAFVRSQLAKGLGDYEVTAANVRELRVRVKKLTGPELLQALDKFSEYNSKFYQEDEKKKGYKPLSIDEYAGTQVFDRTFPINKPLDKSELIKLNWKEILAGAPAAPMFVEIEGRAAEGIQQQGVITQSLVQFTDLGLMQKSNGRETMIFATSLTTGKPVAGVRLTMVDSEQKLLGYADTDANGIATLKGSDPSLVLAEIAGDCSAIQTNSASINGVIPYDIPTAWEDVWKPARRTFVFSDRPLYRPGDTIHLKAHTRLRSGDALTLDTAQIKGRVSIRDPRYRTILDKEITFTSNGSWADDLKLPETPLGWYHLTISFNKEGTDEDSPDAGNHSFRIDDYKPNTFEVKLDGTKVEILADRMKLPMSANYFMGKALSRAKVSWSASSMREFTAPSAFSDFHFGDAPRWAHYGKDRDADGYYDDSNDDPEGEWWVNGDLSIDDDGSAVLEMPMPPPDRAALPQQVRVSAEVTDINQQTISASTEFEVPGAEFILGVKGPQFFGRAGQDTSVEIVAIDSKGKPAAGAVKVDLKIERQEYHTLKIATAGGGSTTKDQVILREELKQSFDLKPATAGSAPSVTVPFKPARGGTYFVTAETMDTKGKKVLSRMPLYVIGGDEFPWAMEDGARILLQPEKKTLKPGEEAVIVVKTPIAGTALVTVERNQVHRQFITQLSPEQPVIKVPVQDAEAPNVFVSVILVRGSDASPKKLKMPEYKLGYCELTVESKVKELKVTLNPSKPEVKPGENFAVAATITDYQGKPVAGSEITLYAVDEGVLSLMGHITPNPSEFFHAPMPLAIHNYTSFDDLLPEEFAARERGNKGFVIGGGGEENESPITLRKNFVATPLWLATAMTDASGQVTADITAPDNLTRYRLMAVAVSQADRFGSGESSFKINKPLMVDPVVPRFARLGDETLLKAVVHNTTPSAGEVEVTLELDATADFIREERFFIPAAIKAPADPKVWKQKVTVKANETAAVSFPVQFAKLGTAKWKWSARTLEGWSGPALNDGTESSLEVTHPTPELREVRYARLGKDPVDNLLAKVNPTVLEGEGTVSVSVSTSRLYEARDALDYILTYPYGCVEQSTSATIPWLALGGYQTLFPDLLSADKTKDAVQKGVNRLLTMTTEEGGLSYWPGGQESSYWGSAYGGLMLLRARDAGANVPPEIIDKLTAYLSKKLRGLEEEKDLYVISDAALALYTLAKAKKPEPAYQNLLHAKRDRLPEVTRLYTALAMCLSDTPDVQIKEMLGWKPPAPPAPPEKKTASKSKSKTKKSVAKAPTKPTPPPAPVWGHWAGNGANKAMRLIAYTHLGLTSDAEVLAQSILQSRNGRGEWGNTYANAWTLTALAAYERSLKKSAEPVLAKVIWDSQQPELSVPAHPGSAKVSFPIDAKLTATPMKIELPAGRELFSRVEARSHPQDRDFKGENKGYAIERAYEKLLPDGSTTDATDLRVGDMVVISLTLDIGGGDRYLAISDPLPSVLEAINPEFETQNARGADQLPEGIEAWFCDHREIHADRALFFTDYAPQKGKFQLRYLARVIAEGDTLAPPAKIEAMYQPDKYGLSPTQHLRTLPSGGGQVAGK
jgi:alpha-2-macroglobulin